MQIPGKVMLWHDTYRSVLTSYKTQETVFSMSVLTADKVKIFKYRPMVIWIGFVKK